MTNAFVLEIDLKLARGVPIPKLSINIKNIEIIAREVRVSLLENSKNTIIGNILTFRSRWEEQYEDRWFFDIDQGQNETKFIIHLNENLTRQMQWNDSGIDILFEFVVFLKKGKQRVIPMSCGHVREKLNKLITCPTGLKLDIKGGSPSDCFNIDENDIKAGRKGFMANVGK